MRKEGVFHYRPEGHKLELVAEGDKRGALAEAAMGQGSVAQAGVVLVMAAVYERTGERYGERATMYVHMEAGHAAQNIHLQAVALGLGSVPVGAFRPEAAAKVVGVPEGQEVVYLIPVGEPVR